MDALQINVWAVVLLVVLAVAFDFMNGFHDAAHSIATVVSTGVLKPQRTVLFAAFFNVLAIAVFHLNVVATIGLGLVQPGVVDHPVVFGALIGAITWNQVTWWYGIPSSRSHAPIGGIVGAVIAKAGAGKPIGTGVGLGAVRDAAAVRWGVAGNIVRAWVFTIPASAFVATVFCWISFTLL